MRFLLVLLLVSFPAFAQKAEGPHPLMQSQVNGLALEMRERHSALEARVTALESQLVEADARLRDLAILIVCGYDPSVFVDGVC